MSTTPSALVLANLASISLPDHLTKSRVTTHAIARYQERIDPFATNYQAHQAILKLLRCAYVERRKDGEIVQVRAWPSNVRLVLNERDGIVLTVLSLVAETTVKKVGRKKKRLAA